MNSWIDLLQDLAGLGLVIIGVVLIWAFVFYLVVGGALWILDVARDKRELNRRRNPE